MKKVMMIAVLIFSIATAYGQEGLPQSVVTKRSSGSTEQNYATIKQLQKDGWKSFTVWDWSSPNKGEYPGVALKKKVGEVWLVRVFGYDSLAGLYAELAFPSPGGEPIDLYLKGFNVPERKGLFPKKLNYARGELKYVSGNFSLFTFDWQ